MSQCCFICNIRSGVYIRNAVNLFGDDLPLKSGRSLPDAVGDIVDKQIKKTAHSNLICKKCQKAIVEYDSLQVRLKFIKTSLLDQFTKSLQKHNLDYETYNKKEIKKLVLPASKLQPLPPDLLLKMGRLPLNKPPPVILPKVKNVMTLPSSSTFNLKVTVGSSVLTQSINTNTVANKTKTINPTITIDPKLIMVTKEEKAKTLVPSKPIVSSSVSTSLVSTSKNNSMLNFHVDSLTKDFLSNAVYKVNSDFEVDNLKSESVDQNDGFDNNEDQPMEIDEDCSLAVMTKNPQNKLDIQEENIMGGDDDKSETEYLDVKLLGGSEGQYVLGKLQILQNDEDDEDGDGDGDEQTIVMDGENGSIIRVVSGQKLVYGEDGEISFMLPDDDLDNNDNGDGQDSNDESQIELQVSGDEETANAIIAAAQEQGGAFIKVESGEMFQVQSVESKNEDENIKQEPQSASQMVIHEDGRFRCLICERNDEKADAVYVGSAEATMQHLKDFHSARLYICRVCGHQERRRMDYAAHIETHNPKNAKTSQNAEKTKMHECTICKKKYTSGALLIGHMNMHTGSRPYSCTICNKNFASKYTHQSHLKTHLDRPRPYKCKLCNKSFFTTQNLSQHEKTHSSFKDFVCNICGKAFGTQHNLEVHGIVHSGNKPFVCGVCGKAFARRAEVRDHMRIHTGERPFSCDICGASFTQRSNLHSHKRATHLDDKRYHCTQCPKRFKRRRLLDYHIKASHTGERPLKCNICRATFVYPEHYKKHARIHSGEKPYTCEVCGKSFNSRDNRNTHRFVHSDRKPYECVVCGTGYMRKQLLYHHMNTSGHLAESIVVNQPRVSKFDENLVSTNSIIIESKMDKLPDTIYEAFEESQEVEDEDKSGKASVNLIDSNGESTILTLHNVEEMKANGTLLDSDGTNLMDLASETLSEEFKEQQANGAIRLVPIELPDGTSGWVAIDA